MTTTETAALRVLRRMFDEGFSTGDDAIVDELCLSRSRGAPRFTIEDTVEAGDVIWVRARGRGTATGSSSGHRAGGRWTSP